MSEQNIEWQNEHRLSSESEQTLNWVKMEETHRLSTDWAQTEPVEWRER